MSTKTITIDLEAYTRLKNARQGEEESFSRVIKRVVRPAFDVDAYLAELDAKGRMSEAALDAVDEQVSRRHRSRPRER